MQTTHDRPTSMSGIMHSHSASFPQTHTQFFAITTPLAFPPPASSETHVKSRPTLPITNNPWPLQCAVSRTYTVFTLSSGQPIKSVSVISTWEDRVAKNKNTGSPVKPEFQINQEFFFFFSIRTSRAIFEHMYTKKLFVVSMKFKLTWYSIFYLGTQ